MTGQVGRTAIGDVSLPVTQGRGPVSPWGFAPVWLWWSLLIARPQPSMHAIVACCCPFVLATRCCWQKSNHVLMVILVVGERLSGSQKALSGNRTDLRARPNPRIPNGYVTREEGGSELVACWCRKASVRAAIPAAHAWLSAVVLCTSLLKAELLKRRVTWVPRAI